MIIEFDESTPVHVIKELAAGLRCGATGAAKALAAVAEPLVTTLKPHLKKAPSAAAPRQQRRGREHPPRRNVVNGVSARPVRRGMPGV